MKQLFIARHARAEFDDSIPDDQRHLTARGVSDCVALAKAMSELKLPELIICSSAKRTHQTAINLVKSLPQNVPIELRDDLYNASILEIKEIIASVSDKYQHLMLIGHNPAIHQLVMHFADNARLSREDFLQLNAGMVPAAVALFEFNKLASWKDFANAKSKMTWFFKPLP
jgi:phosphohistidine phosphatase